MKHCLVADDSDVIRKISRRILESLQFEVSEAQNGQEAIDLCGKRMPDAVLLDWLMPTMNGTDFITALRQLPGGKRPVIIYCTTENDPFEISKAIKLGADHYLMKPFDRQSILQKLEEASLT